MATWIKQLVCVVAVFFCLHTQGMYCGDGILFTVRKAVLADCDSILSIDREVTFEFFVPLFSKESPIESLSDEQRSTFAHEMMTYFIKELQAEMPLLIEGKIENTVVYIASHSITSDIVGFIIFKYDPLLKTVLVEPLEVSQKARGMGVGRLLVEEAWRVFPEALYCCVSPINRDGNKAALSFYQRLGFGDASHECIEKFRALYPETIQTGVEWAPSYNGDKYYARYVMTRPVIE